VINFPVLKAPEPTPAALEGADAGALIAAVRRILPHASALWLFGSATRHALQADSDLDIAVLLPEPLAGRDKLLAAEALADALGRDVDLLDFARLHTVMQVQILETGSLLFADEPAKLWAWCGRIRTEYLHIQRWRQPMIARLAEALVPSRTPQLALGSQPLIQTFPG
jgi:uncharacterized protein